MLGEIRRSMEDVMFKLNLEKPTMTTTTTTDVLGTLLVAVLLKRLTFLSAFVNNKYKDFILID